LMNIFRNGITKLFLNTVTTHKLFIFCSLALPIGTTLGMATQPLPITLH